MNPAAKKVLVRLLVILACFVVLGIINFSRWRVRLAHDVAHQIGAIRSSGLPTNAEEENTYYPAVPDSENAALKMADAFALLSNYNDARSNQVASIKFPQRKENLTQEELQILADYCAMNSNVLAQAREAVKMARCRYPVDLSQGAHASLKHLFLLKKTAQLAEFEAIVGSKDPTSDISTIVSIAHSLDDEPILISKLIRIVMLNMAATALEHELNSKSFEEQDMILLEKVFAEAAKTNQMANALIGDRAAFLSVFHMSPYEISRLADSNDEIPSNQPNESLPKSQSRFARFAGVFDLDERFYLQAMATNISLASTFPKNISLINDMARTTSQTLKRHRYIISNLLLSANGTKNVYSSAIFKEASGLAQIRSAQTALAIERFRLAHGKLPEKLAELVPQFLSAVPNDPFDSQPLRYHRLEKGYVVYSIGSDGEDNGGRERPASAKSTDKTPYDITFTVER